MILLSAHDKDEIEIHIKSEFGVNVTIKNHDRSTIVFTNIRELHWLDSPTNTTLRGIITDKANFGSYHSIPNSAFYWLSFEPATKIQS